jgi:hypothetical protein
VDKLRNAGISVNAIVVAVILLVCFALLDRIPDPPTVLQSRASSSVVCSHAVSTREGGRLALSLDNRWEFGTVAIFTVAPQHDALRTESVSFWRAAGDSSPPSFSVFV